MQPVVPNAQKNRRVALMAAGVFCGMVGLAYASVPLYDLFCRVTGFGGRPQIADKAPANATTEKMVIRFDANVSGELDWTFQPQATTMTVNVGEPYIAKYIAHNTSTQSLTGSAVFNVTPTEAGIYFNKIECFCFTKQTLKPGETVEMPVEFFVDPALLENANAKGIKEITLSYSFYPVKDTPAEAAANKTN
jgi:cytochrome c oxidase assembly protein subunit 11